MLPLTFYFQTITASGMPALPRPGTIRLHDSTLGIWEETFHELDFKRQVFGPLIRFLRESGWRVGRDAKTHRHYRCLSPTTRHCRLGDLEAHLALRGRSIEFAVFQNVANVSNPNGGRYDFDRLDRMPPRLRLRCIATLRKTVAFLRERHGYTLSLPDVEVKHLGPETMTAAELVERQYATCVHTRKELGRPDWGADYNRKSASGALLEQAQPVFIRDRSGRWLRGRAFYRLNSMWAVITGPYSLEYRSCHEIHMEPPADLREKANTRKRRERLETELSAAVRSMDFARAARLKAILFGDQPLFRIWSEKKDAWYGPCCCHYTSDAAKAGLYTETEAHSAADGVPHLRIVPVEGAAPRRPANTAAPILAAAE